MEQKKPDLEKYLNLPNPGLRSYLDHNVQGNPDDYRPPFWGGAPRENVLSMWQKIVDASTVKRELPELYAFEMEMKEKVGPMSIQKPLSERIPKVKEYYTRVSDPGEPIDERAIELACKFFGSIRGVRMKSQNATVEAMRLSTNSGTPYFTKRRSVIDKTIPLRIKGGQQFLPRSTYELAAIMGWRGQEGGIDPDDVKQRIVFMFPFGLNVAELQVYQPLITALQSKQLIPAYVSMDRVDQQVTAMFDGKSPSDLVICTDFSGFDQGYNEHMQYATRRVLEYLLTPTDQVRDWFENVFPLKYEIPLICSEDIMFTGKHGMGSGSGGTNPDECLGHKCLQEEAALDAGQILNPNSMAYGDDGALTYPGITIDQVMRTYTRHGQVMNDSKQYASTHDCVILRRWHGTNYRDSRGIMVGVYSTYRALGRLLAQERFYDPDKWSNEKVILRAWSIIENCNHSPLFESFVDFVMNTGDKYRLGLGIPGFMDRIEHIAREAKDEFNDFLGYTKTMQTTGTSTIGIRNWRIYKYLKSKESKR